MNKQDRYLQAKESKKPTISRNATLTQLRNLLGVKEVKVGSGYEISSGVKIVNKSKKQALFDLAVNRGYKIV